MKINIDTIPHDKQRYETCGDWWFDEDGTLQIRVSSIKYLPHLEFLVALHEMIEATLCQWRGISEQSVTDFDMKFESERLMKQHKEEDEPGDDPRAPYRKEHFFATTMEALMAHELGVDWSAYEKTILSLE